MHPTLRKHLNDCYSVIEDLRSVQAEAHFRAARDVDIVYAVDSSELQNYLYPLNQEHYIGFVFALNGYEPIVYTDACLNALLFTPGSRHFLLPGHISEVHTIINSVTTQNLPAQNAEVLDALCERIEADTRTLEIEGKGNAIFRVMRSEDGSIERVKTSFLEIIRTAPDLYGVALHKKADPVQRLKFLTGRFRPSVDLGGIRHDQIHESTRDWFTKFLTSRRPTSRIQNIQDALALEFLFRANSAWRTTNTWLRLVTRSELIVDAATEFLAQPEAMEQLGEGITVFGELLPVRRSRTFVLQAAPPLAGSADARVGILQEIAEEVRGSFEAEFAQTDGGLNAAGNYQFDVLEGQFGRLKEAWRNIAASTIAQSAYPTVVDPEESEKIFLERFMTFKSPERARDAIARHIAELNDQLIEANTQFVYFVESLRSSNSPISLRSWLYHERVRISFEQTSFPYEFEFYDNYFKRTRGGARSGVDLEVVLGYLREKDASWYEQRLAMALHVAAKGEWRKALNLARYAIIMPRRKSVPRHEGYYLCAVAERRLAETSADLARALRWISDAKKLRSQGPGGRYADPRYLREEAAASFGLAYLTEKVGGSPDNYRRKALKLTERASEAYGNDHRGRAQTLQATISYSLDRQCLGVSATSVLEGVFAHRFKQWLIAVIESKRPPTLEAPRFLGSYMEGHFLLELPLEDSVVADGVRRLRSAVQDGNLPGIELSLITNQLARIESYITRA